MVKKYSFKDLKFKPHPVGDGLAARLDFPNGYGVSVVRFKMKNSASLPDLFAVSFCNPGRAYASYTNDESEWELAVFKKGQICYSTPITDDVMGHLKARDVTRVMNRVAKLPKVTEVVN